MGTSVIPMQSYAGSASDYYKSKIKSSTQTDKMSASQHMDQDNLCYRGDECQQGNEGKQTVDKDNDASRFNEQSLNVLQSNAPTPTQKTCEECFTSNLNPSQLEAVRAWLASTPSVNIAGYCNVIDPTDEAIVRAELAASPSGLPQNVIDNIIKCLQENGFLNPSAT